MKKINPQTLIERLNKNGWSPVSWAHHPDHIKLAIKAANFRPAAKSCFANAQRLIVCQNKVPLTYVEGIVEGKIPFLHAWVKDAEGVYHDITIGKMYPVLYSKEYSSQEVLDEVLNTKVWNPINGYDLDLRYQALMFGLDIKLTIEVIEKGVKEKISQLPRFERIVSFDKEEEYEKN